MSCIAFVLYKKQKVERAAEPDSWADALHPLYKEQVQGKSYTNSGTGETQQAGKKQCKMLKVENKQTKKKAENRRC